MPSCLELPASCQVLSIAGQISQCEVKIVTAKDGFHRGHFRDSHNTGGNLFPLRKSVLSILPEL